MFLFITEDDIERVKLDDVAKLNLDKREARYFLNDRFERRQEENENKNTWNY